MSDVNQLLSRIDAEFAGLESRVKAQQNARIEQYHEREKRVEQFEQLLGQLRDIWRPRLEALAQRFGDRVKVSPSVAPGSRQATFQFQSPLARVNLRFAASTDTDVTKLVVSYDLDILPILMQFEKHAEATYPIDRVDHDGLAQWLDDRIVTFVKTYLALHENEYYLKDFMVEDPVAHVRFPKFAAGAKLERDGKTLYFVSEETRQEFEKQKG